MELNQDWALKNRF